MNLNNEISKKQYIPIFIFLFVSLLLIALSFLNIFNPLYGLNDILTKSFRANLYKSSMQTDAFTSFIVNPSTYLTENENLKKQLYDLKSLQVENIKLQEENKALSSQIGSPLANKKGFILALIISKSDTLNTINIDKGTNEGVYTNSIVVYKNILLGKIISAFSESAQVQLISDVNSSVPVVAQSSTVNGILNGSLQFGLVMNEILPNESVNINDNILTSGLGEIYPKDLLVGTVKSIQPVSSQPLKTAVITPAINIDDLSYVFIIKK